ncbi:hypothetical protein BRC89_04340 [Halobacteriales archaeon QS_4_70_19]|nr:MAG: hypothetical protein BRC89_04340 [Halobacteriales archaeon QS_4_70_19]
MAGDTDPGTGHGAATVWNEYELTERGRELLPDQLGWVFDYYVTDAGRTDDLQELIEANH